MVNFEGEEASLNRADQEVYLNKKPKTYSRRTVLGLGVAAIAAGGASLAAGSVIDPLDRVLGYESDKKIKSDSKNPKMEQKSLVVGSNLVLNGSFTSYASVENGAGVYVPRPLGWEEAHHNYEYAELILGAGPDGQNVVRAGKISDGKGGWIPAVWTPQELIRVDAQEEYSLFFKYRVEGDLSEVVPYIAVQQRDGNRKPVEKPVEANLFPASTGDWQAAGFEIKNLGQKTRFLVPEFSFVDLSKKSAPARVSFADIHFGKLRMEYGNPSFPGSKRA